MSSSWAAESIASGNDRQVVQLIRRKEATHTEQFLLTSFKTCQSFPGICVQSHTVRPVFKAGAINVADIHQDRSHDVGSFWRPNTGRSHAIVAVHSLAGAGNAEAPMGRFM